MINVLLFAELKERAGTSSLEVPEEKLRVLELKERLQATYPNISLQGVLTAVNEEYAKDEDEIRAGDTVAFIPPVSGG